MEDLLSFANRDEKQIPEFSVSEISGEIKRFVETAFARVRVRGEIFGAKRADSGHWYLSLKDEMYKEFYPHIMEISLEVAKKIIKKEVEANENILKSTIMSTLDEINPETEKITIKVNSEDLEFATVSLPEIIQTKGLTTKINIVPDDTIEKGSCIVIANNGVIDANFKTQLAVLQNAFGIYKGGL